MRGFSSSKIFEQSLYSRSIRQHALSSLHLSSSQLALHATPHLMLISIPTPLHQTNSKDKSKGMEKSQDKGKKRSDSGSDSNAIGDVLARLKNKKERQRGTILHCIALCYVGCVHAIASIPSLSVMSCHAP